MYSLLLLYVVTIISYKIYSCSWKCTHYYYYTSYYNIIQDILVLVEMYSYSFSALSNVLILNHHQSTHTRTLLMKMYSTPGLVSDVTIWILQLSLTIAQCSYIGKTNSYTFLITLKICSFLTTHHYRIGFAVEIYVSMASYEWKSGCV